LEHVAIGKRDTILDVGCGGGRTIRKLSARAREGKVYGIDHAQMSVAVAKRTNRFGIARGRIDIREGSVSRLPFADDMFDLVTAVETHFWWPDLPADLREVVRVLRPGGQLLLLAEVYKGGQYDQRVQKLIQLTKMVILSVPEHRALLSNAGCMEVQVVEHYDKGWICGVGRKPL
jgi:ubiquinone/menaquinone biosynthesis C-methylase UbiE